MKNWWQTFFKPITAEIMFKPREGELTRIEASQVLSQVPNKKKKNILDLCCGEGRHCLEFAKRGHQVTGLDFTSGFLKTAKDRAKKAKLPIKYVKGDMKAASQVVGTNNFDLVVSLYNSFGFFDRRAEDFKTLKEVQKVLKPGGYFVINTLNGDGVKDRLKNPLSAGYEVQKNVFILDKAHLDTKEMRTVSKWTIVDARQGKAKIFRQEFGQNVYSHQEMKDMLTKAGFRVVKTWGPLHGGNFKKTSWHQTVLAQKI